MMGSAHTEGTVSAACAARGRGRSVTSLLIPLPGELQG